MQATFDSFIDKADIDKRKLPYQDFSFAYDDRVLVQLTREFLDQKRDKPFFLVINTVFPHHPYHSGWFSKVRCKDTRWAVPELLHFADHVLARFTRFLKIGAWPTTRFCIALITEKLFSTQGQQPAFLYVYEENVNTLVIFINKNYSLKESITLNLKSH